MADEAAKELFGLVREVKAELAELRATLTRMEQDRKDHEERLRKLEEKEAKRSGVLAAASIIGGLIVSGLAWLVKMLTGQN